MKKLLSLLLLLCSATLFAQPVNFDSLALKMLRQNLAIKTGETVYIYSDQNDVPLMEALTKACEGLGATAYPKINPDKLQGSESMNTFLESEFASTDKFIDWLNSTDACIILTPFDKDPKWLFKNLDNPKNTPEQQQALRKALVKTHVRMLCVTIPSRAFAEGFSLPYEPYEQMTWNAIDGVYTVEQVDRLKALLAHAKQITLTSPQGTNLTFSVTDRPVLVYNGSVTPEEAASHALYNKFDKLPAGVVEVSIVENSANGKLVVSQTECDYEAVNQATLTFVSGKLQILNSKDGSDCLKAKFATPQGAENRIGSISFGFNPLLKSNGLYWPKAATATVILTLGGNQFAGGQNDINTPQVSFPVSNVTVAIDGKVVLR